MDQFTTLTMALSALRRPSSRYIQMHILPMYENLSMHHVIQPEKKLWKSLMLTLITFWTKQYIYKIAEEIQQQYFEGNYSISSSKTQTNTTWIDHGHNLMSVIHKVSVSDHHLHHHKPWRAAMTPKTDFISSFWRFEISDQITRDHSNNHIRKERGKLTQLDPNRFIIEWRLG